MESFASHSFVQTISHTPSFFFKTQSSPSLLFNVFPPPHPLETLAFGSPLGLSCHLLLLGHPLSFMQITFKSLLPQSSLIFSPPAPFPPFRRSHIPMAISLVPYQNQVCTAAANIWLLNITLLLFQLFFSRTPTATIWRFNGDSQYLHTPHFAYGLTTFLFHLYFCWT